MKNIQLPDLPYGYDALEPVISAEIMKVHHDKHHRGYVDNLNIALEKYQQAESKNDLAEMIAAQSAIRFNGGGHINHSLFWENLAPQSKGGGGVPGGKLSAAIKRDFGSFDAFQKKFQSISASIQGSGWGWLSFNKDSNILQIVPCSNHELVTSMGHIPLLTVDMWEHAYYLQYKNMKADYLKTIWSIINWPKVEERFILPAA